MLENGVGGVLEGRTLELQGSAKRQEMFCFVCQLLYFTGLELRNPFFVCEYMMFFEHPPPHTLLLSPPLPLWLVSFVLPGSFLSAFLPSVL